MNSKIKGFECLGPKIRQMRRLIPLLLASSFLGCGSDSAQISANNFSLSGNGSSVAEIPDPAGTVRGQVLLDQPAVGAEILFFAPDGTPLPTLGPVVSKEAGLFVGQLLVPVADFRVVARLNGEAYAADYRGYQVGEHMAITPLTNLVSAYMSAHSTSLEASSVAVRALLGLPETFDLRHDMAVSTQRSGFVASNYLAEARASGQNASQDGISSFAVSYLSRTPAPQADPQYPEVPGPSNAIFESAQAKLATAQALQLGVAVITSVLQFVGVPGVPVIGWALTIFTGDVFGDPQQIMLRAISEEIKMLSQELSQVQDAIEKDILLTSFNRQYGASYSQEISYFQARALTLQQSFSISTSNTVSNITTDLTSTTTLSHLQSVHDTLMSAAGVPGLLQQAETLVQLNQNPFYCNATRYSPIQQVFLVFYAIQSMGIRVIVEGFNGSTPSQPNSARLWFERFQTNAAGQASMIPQPMVNDQLIYQRNSGHLFFQNSMPPQPHPGPAETATKKLRVGPFKYWRVATQGDYKHLFGDDRFGIDLNQLRNQENFKMSSSPNNNNSNYRYGTDEGYVLELDKGFPYVAYVFNRDDDTLWVDSGDNLPYMVVADLQRSFNELHSSQPEIFLPMARLQSLRIENVAGEGRLRALGNYSLEIDGRSQAMNDVDITHLVQWSSTNSALGIQNAPASNKIQRLSTTPAIRFGPGVYTWHGNGEATVTASLFDSFDPALKVFSADLKLTQQNYTPQIASILISPKRPRTLGVPTVSDLYPIVFYQDGSSAQAVNNISWSVQDENGTAIPATVAEVKLVNTQYQLDIHSRLGAFPSTLNITATTQNGKSDTVTVTY